MKYITALFMVMILGFTWTPAAAQLPASVEIYNNHVRGVMYNNSSLFWDLKNAGFAYPGAVMSPQKSTHTIFAQGLWMSGIHPGNNHAIAATTYWQKGKDYMPGPIDDKENSEKWAVVWYVEGADIFALIEDWDDNGVINKTPARSLLEWPGRGNPLFEELTGLQLPDREMAPFFDRDGDGIYNPWKGDYPIIRTDCESIIPGSMGWTLFHDAVNHSESDSPSPLFMEVRTTVFSFTPISIESIDHTIFVKNEITSFYPQEITDFRVGHWVDANIGCYIDDLIGCEPDQNTFYAYNSSDWDQTPCPAGISSYSYYPPVQTVTFLNKPLGSFIKYTGPSFNNPDNYIRFLNMNKGIWPDGTSITASGDGFNTQGDTTTYLFFDRPSNPDGWSAWTAGMEGSPQRMLGSAVPEVIAPGQAYTLYSAYTVHREIGLLVPDMVDMALDRIPEIQLFFDNCFTWPGATFESCQEECVWPGDLDNNGMVNNLDLLYYGVRHGREGIPRDHYFAGWQPQTAVNWDKEDALPQNAKHTDADGNGIIDELDADVAMYHLYRTREGFVDWGGSNDPGDDLTAVRVFNPWTAPDTILSPGDRLMVRFTFRNPVDDPIYGLGYSIRYDTTILEPIPLDGDQDFFTNGLGTSIFQRAWQRPDGVDVFATRTDGAAQQVNTWHMLQMRFIVKPQPPPSNNPVTTIRYQNYLLLREDGSSIPISAHGLDIQYGPITSTELVEAPGALRLWPNPGRDLLYLASPVPLYRVMVHDQVGRRVIDQAFSGEEALQIPTHQLAAGMYLVEAMDAAGNRLRERWIKMN